MNKLLNSSYLLYKQISHLNFKSVYFYSRNSRNILRNKYWYRNKVFYKHILFYIR